jgi:hypothetical protein
MRISTKRLDSLRVSELSSVAGVVPAKRLLPGTYLPRFIIHSHSAVQDYKNGGKIM